MADHDNDFWDFAAFWEFFNPFKDKKTNEEKAIPKTIKKVYDINSLIRDLGSEDVKVADSAQETLERLGEVVIPSLIQALGNESLSIRGRAGWALVNIGKVVVNPVIEALNNENPEVRFYAAFVLQMLADPRAVEPLIKMLKEDKVRKCRNAASLALFAIKDPRAKEPLKEYGEKTGTRFLFQDELQPEAPKEVSKIYEEEYERIKKEFFEKIFPILKENPGILQSDLIEKGIDPTVFYKCEKIGLIKREKSRGFKIFLPDVLPNIEERKFLLEGWRGRVAIPAKAYPDSKERIIGYFGKDVLKEFFKYSWHYKHWQEYNERFGRAEDDVDGGFLTSIGACLDLDMNEPMKEVISLYWTKECDGALRKYYSKYGFFADKIFIDIELKKILGEERFMNFYAELEAKAHLFEIKWCGFSWDCIRSYHIPWDYAQYLRFKWGLRLEINHKYCIQCNEQFNPFIFGYRDFFPSFDTNFVMRHYPIKESILEINFCPKHLLSKSYNTLVTDYFAVKDDREQEILKKQISSLLKKLIDVLGFIPERNFHETFSYLDNLEQTKFEETVKILNEMPSFDGYKKVYGSWLQALDAAGVIEGGIRKTSRGYACLAKDGHECFSLGEKIIDDYLYTHNIPHEKEPYYPGGRKFRADWKVGLYFIEFWGLEGDEDYDKKIEEKKSTAHQYQIPLIEINVEDLQDLEQKFQDIIVQ